VIVQALIDMNGTPPALQSNLALARSVVLVTGMSGSGKSTVLDELARRGHRVVDTDDRGWIVQIDTSDGPEPVWNLDRIVSLIDAHRSGALFIGGCVANQGSVYERFDAVVLLSAPVDVILARVAHRANPFGSASEDRTKIARDLAEFEPQLRAGADHEIVTTVPIADVAAELEQLASRVGQASR
jgi:dephospho-CoA kinase